MNTTNTAPHLQIFRNSPPIIRKRSESEVEAESDWEHLKTTFGMGLIWIASMVPIVALGFCLKWLSDYPSDLEKLARGHIAAMQRDGSITNVVNILLK